VTGIRMPDEQRLPPGPRRELVSALHDLYELAGKPAARAISERIRARDDLPGTLSHEGVSSVLRGSGVPRWANLESLVRVLVERRRVGEPDVEAIMIQIHGLWRIADGDPSVSRPYGPPLLATLNRRDSIEALAPDEEAGDIASGERSGGQKVFDASLAPILRWNPRQRTLDVFDRQMAVEIFKEVGGIMDAARGERSSARR
jgi:hypothetical protein